MNLFGWASLVEQAMWEKDRQRVAQRAWMHHVHRQAFLAQWPNFRPTQDWETALYVDWRVGFAQAFPGAPQPHPVIFGGGDPVHDAYWVLSDAPMGVRFHLGTPTVSAADAQAGARAQLEAFVTTRGGTDIIPREPTIDQKTGWMVEGAMSATYSLAQPDPFGGDREEAVMLVRTMPPSHHAPAHLALMTITMRWPSRALDPFRHALLRSAALGTIRWDPTHPQQQPPRIWPNSTFLEPGVEGKLKGYRDEQIPKLAPAFAMADVEKQALAQEVEKCVTRIDPPWSAVSRGEIEALVFALSSTNANPLFEPMLRSMLGEVRTMHDVRGVALLIGRAAAAAWKAR
mgnify:CR=1 FL=1